MWLPGIRAALIRLKCPHCGETQARARLAQGAEYKCRKCRRTFTREQGLAATSTGSTGGSKKR